MELTDKVIKKLNGTATCESCLEGFGAQNACDEDSRTCWKADPYFKWWIIDLEKICFIDRINIILGHDGEFYHYHIEHSVDRINWEFDAEKKDDSVSTPKGDTHSLNVTARFIRITVSYCSVSSVVTIENVSAYGYEDDSPKDYLKDPGKKRVKFAEADLVKGFDIEENTDVGDCWYDSVISTVKAGGMVSFKNVDFGNGLFDQLRLCIGLPVKDKMLYNSLEMRIDAPDGEIVGKIHLCRQYTVFTELAVEMLAENGERIRGRHDLYIIVTEVTEPQKILLYWFSLNEHTKLLDKVTDYREQLIEDDKPYNIFFGNMHCHTGLTDGFGTAEHAYDYARNVAKMDFLGITEHSNCLDEMFDCDKSFKWRDLKASAERATKDGEFVGIYGSETTWYNQFGHMNIYCSDFYLNSYEFKFDDAKTYYKKLKEFPGIISQWNHPWSCGARHLDLFEPYDPELDKITYTIELNNIELIKDDVLKYYIIALDKGWHLSPVGNQDNHKENWGTENGIRTGIIARRLTAADIFDAMKNGRTYFTGAPGFRVMYSINGHIQGSVIDDADELLMEVNSSCDDGCRIKMIEIYGENGKIVETIECNAVNVMLKHPITEKQKYYFLKVIREDDQIAVTAPIWINR